MGIFRELREKQGLTVYRVSKDLGLSHNEAARLDDHETGERYLKLLLEFCAKYKIKLSEVQKIIKGGAKR